MAISTKKTASKKSSPARKPAKRSKPRATPRAPSQGKTKSSGPKDTGVKSGAAASAGRESKPKNMPNLNWAEKNGNSSAPVQAPQSAGNSNNSQAITAKETGGSKGNIWSQEVPSKPVNYGQKDFQEKSAAWQDKYGELDQQRNDIQRRAAQAGDPRPTKPMRGPHGSGNWERQEAYQQKLEAWESRNTGAQPPNDKTPKESASPVQESSAPQRETAPARDVRPEPPMRGPHGSGYSRRLEEYQQELKAWQARQN